MADTVKACLIYSVPPADGSRAYIDINTDSSTGLRGKNFTEESFTVEIENIRGKEGDYTLDNAGFQFHREAAQHKTFANDEEVEREYYPESIELLKRLTGASRVVLFDHSEYMFYVCTPDMIFISSLYCSAIRRNRPGEIDDGPQKRKPVPRVHVDQTSASAVARVHRHLPAGDAESLLKRRFQIINLWRPIHHVALDWPLALCDYRSIDRKTDLFPTALRYPDREGETSSVKYNPAHKWIYARGMTPEEVVLIKWYVSNSPRLPFLLLLRI